jgi:hypothetical protein
MYSSGRDFDVSHFFLHGVLIDNIIGLITQHLETVPSFHYFSIQNSWFNLATDKDYNKRIHSPLVFFFCMSSLMCFNS